MSIVSLSLAKDIGAKRVHYKIDSQLSVGHIKGTFQVKDKLLI